MGCHLSPNVGSFVAWSVHSKNLGLQRELSKATSKHSTRYTSIPYIFLSHLFRQSHTHITQYLCCLCSFIFQLKMLPLLLLDPFGAASCSWNFVTSVDLRGACIRGCFVPENCMCIRGMFCDWKLLQHSGLWYHCLPDCFCFLLVNVEHYRNLTDNKRQLSLLTLSNLLVFDFPCSCSIVWCVFSLDFPRLQGGPANVKLHYDPDSIDGKHLGLNFTASFSCAGRILCHYFHSILSIACTCLSL